MWNILGYWYIECFLIGTWIFLELCSETLDHFVLARFVYLFACFCDTGLAGNLTLVLSGGGKSPDFPIILSWTRGKGKRGSSLHLDGDRSFSFPWGLHWQLSVLLTLGGFGTPGRTMTLHDASSDTTSMGREHFILLGEGGGLHFPHGLHRHCMGLIAYYWKVGMKTPGPYLAWKHPG